jgi:hypothetical protein
LATTHDTRKAAPFFIAKPVINAPQKRAKVEIRLAFGSKRCQLVSEKVSET